MSPVHSVEEVFAGIQNARKGNVDFCTNFFPAQAKLQAWITHGELLTIGGDGTTFFLRKDRDLWHFYFCAASPALLRREVMAVSELQTERVVTDVVGNKSALGELLVLLQSVGFRRYAQLERMARVGRKEEFPSANCNLQVVCAQQSDCPSILNLIESAFDRYAEQLPMSYEVESVVQQGQIFVAKEHETLGGLLFFETQGLASTVRFWVVDERFRARRVGSALMMHYFKTQNAVRRFTLWVNSDNDDAIEKYGHFGYAPDGLVDYVLANQMIPT